jgi:hypothetical protein
VDCASVALPHMQKTHSVLFGTHKHLPFLQSALSNIDTLYVSRHS